MWTLTGDILIAIGAYVLSIYTWPWIRTQALGVAAEASALRAKAASLEDKLRGK